MEPMRRQSVVITGAGGFAGPYLVRELLKRQFDVYAVDRHGAERAREAGAKVRAVDLCDPAQIDSLLREFHPQLNFNVVHLAGWSHVGKSWEYPVATFEANLVNSVSLYQAVSRLWGPRARFLYVSSAEVYGKVKGDQLPLDEDSPVNPSSPYGMSKLMAEKTLKALHRQGGSDLVIARPFNHIGPGQSADFALPAFARRITAIERGEENIFRHGNLDSARDMIDVRDLARAYSDILVSGDPGETFVVASGQSFGMRWLVEKLFHLAGQEPRMAEDPNLRRPVDIPELRGSAGKLFHRTGWSPEIPIEQTLADILADARARHQAA